VPCEGKRRTGAQGSSRAKGGEEQGPIGQVKKLEAKWTRVGGLRIHARAAGDPASEGRAVVLVHGLVVSSRYMVPTAERLAPYRRVFVPDLPGFGRSETPPHVLDVSGLSDTLAHWMEEVGLECAVLVGNSFGCQIIADLAVRHPERIEHAVLQGPTMDPRGRTVLQQVGRFLLDMPREPLSFVPIELLDFLNAGTRRSWRTFRYALEDRIEEKLPHMRVPTLVVRGSQDPIVPQRWAREVAELLPMGRLAAIPGAAHAANYDRAMEFARMIQGFLDDGGRPPSEGYR
jgi:2-hydroxy-6-oxonona-2,4-dienedioate hydrolase